MDQNSPENDNDGSIYELKIEYHGCVEIKAAIRSNPKDLPIVWTKGSEKIDLKNPKYRGSSSNCDHSVLRINKVTKDEEGLYRIEARNEFKGKQLCDKFNLIVIGGTMALYTCLIFSVIEIHPLLNFSTLWKQKMLKTWFII